MTVSVESMKAHLNVTFSDDDTIIAEKIAAASSYVETHLGYELATQYPDGTPAAIDEAIRQIAAHYYENREASLVGTSASVVPMSADDILNSFRGWSFGHVE